MTEEELSVMERLWSMNVPVKQIAEVLGYSTDTIINKAADHRHRFPYRKRRFSRAVREEWTEEILSGRRTKKDAMAELGVCDETVNRWLRERRRKDGMSISKRSEDLYTGALTRRNLCDTIATLEDDKRLLLKRISDLEEKNGSMLRAIARLEEELAEREEHDGD